MDVLVAVGERERAVVELGGHLVEAATELDAILGTDDPPRREHRRVRERLVDVEGAQPPVEEIESLSRRKAWGGGSLKRDMGG